MPLTTGRILLSAVGLVTSTGCYIADWNDTHIYNPLWLPHAKFHNAQTMAMGLLLGLSTLYYTHTSPLPALESPHTTSTQAIDAKKDTTERERTVAQELNRELRLRHLHFAVLSASLYWVTQLMAWFYPGVAAVDPPADPYFFPQGIISAVLLSVTAGGWWLEKKAIMSS